MVSVLSSYRKILNQQFPHFKMILQTQRTKKYVKYVLRLDKQMLKSIRSKLQQKCKKS